MGVQEGDETLFEYAVQYVRFRLRFQYFFRRPSQIVETFREYARSNAFEFLPRASSYLGDYGGEEIAPYFVRRLSGNAYYALGLAVFQPFLEYFLAPFRYHHDNGMKKIPFSKAFLVHGWQS